MSKKEAKSIGEALESAVPGEAAEVAYQAYTIDQRDAGAFAELPDTEQTKWRRVAAALATSTAIVHGGRPSIDPITGDRLT